MPPWKGIVGKSFSAAGFDQYCRTLQWTTWKPSFIVLHNTWNPTLAMRPDGYTQQHMKNAEHYYRNVKGWSAGPHLIVDDRQIWVFTPLTTSGVHSPSWNGVSLGVEMLGDYETEEFESGRGLKVRQLAVSAIATLCDVLALDPAAMRLHREDKKTTHRKCPGKNVDKAKFIASVQTSLIQKVLQNLGARFPWLPF